MIAVGDRVEGECLLWFSQSLRVFWMADMSVLGQRKVTAGIVGPQCLLHFIEGCFDLVDVVFLASRGAERDQSVRDLI